MAQIAIDTAGWTQDEKNALHAATSLALFQAGVTHLGIKVVGEIIEVKNPSQNVSGILTKDNLKTIIDEEAAKLAVANKAAQLEAEVRRAEIASSPMRDIKLAQVDAAIENIDNLPELKAFLKKFVRYILALVE